MTFTVTGDPKGQPRPRAFAFRGHARVYDAGTAEGWKSLVAAKLHECWDSIQFTGPVTVELQFHMRRPKGHYGAKGLRRSAPSVWHTQKPDADNLAKAVLDALTQCGLWADDAQVASLNVQKLWSNCGQPGCRIEVVSLDAEPAQPHVVE